MDNRHLCVGCTAFFPVAVPGALFSCGDGHAAQGDGEVAGSAIETGMFCRMRLTVLKPVRWPICARISPSVRLDPEILRGVRCCFVCCLALVSCVGLALAASPSQASMLCTDSGGDTSREQGDHGNWGGMTPRYITPDPALMYKAGPQFGVSGVNDDLVAATRQALKEMVEWLTLHQGFTPYEALVLCSCAADFKSESPVSSAPVSSALPTVAFCSVTAPVDIQASSAVLCQPLRSALRPLLDKLRSAA